MASAAPLLRGARPSDAVQAEAAPRPPQAAAVDRFIDRFGLFQWKVCAVVGAMVYGPAGWIMLPVFVNPLLTDAAPETFTADRLALLGSLFFAGWAVGAPSFSAVADRVGRKRLLLCLLPLCILAGCLPSLPEAALHWLPPTVFGQPRFFLLHAASRFLLVSVETVCRSHVLRLSETVSSQGFGIGACACGYVWMMEWLPGAARAHVTVAMNCIWAVVAIGLAGLAALLNAHRLSWRLLPLAASAPFVPVWLLCAFAVPESARWLMQTDQIARAELSLRSMSATNGSPLPPDFQWPWARRASATEVGDALPAVPAKAAPASAVWTWTLIGHSAVLFLCWFTATLVYCQPHTSPACTI